jgi:hypothetical protein
MEQPVNADLNSRLDALIAGLGIPETKIHDMKLRFDLNLLAKLPVSALSELAEIESIGDKQGACSDLYLSLLERLHDMAGGGKEIAPEFITKFVSDTYAVVAENFQLRKIRDDLIAEIFNATIIRDLKAGAPNAMLGRQL